MLTLGNIETLLGEQRTLGNCRWTSLWRRNCHLPMSAIRKSRINSPRTSGYQARARMSVWWPGVTTSITELVTKFSTWEKHRPEPKKPLMSSLFPSRQWERLGMDVFELKGKSYLLVVDYYSRWIDVKRFHNQFAVTVINALKEIFGTHGIPDQVISDSGRNLHVNFFSNLQLFTYSLTLLVPQGIRGSTKRWNEQLKKSSRRMKTLTLVFWAHGQLPFRTV